MAHTLAVADVRLAIQQILDAAPTILTIEVQIESAAWCRYLGLGGDRRLIQPDLAAVMHGHDQDGEYQDRRFIEVDCGAESLPIMLKKYRQYDDYRQSGNEQTERGVFPRILWVMGGPSRSPRSRRLPEWHVHRRVA